MREERRYKVDRNGDDYLVESTERTVLPHLDEVGATPWVRARAADEDDDKDEDDTINEPPLPASSG